VPALAKCKQTPYVLDEPERFCAADGRGDFLDAGREVFDAGLLAA
jgi:hypothetical protein